MTKLESIVVSNTEPNSKNVLWYDNKRLLIFSNGHWSPIVDLDDIDVDNLPGVSNLQEALKSLNIKVDNKVDKVEGKGLSTNDYTDREKSRLSTLPTATELDAALDAKLDKSVWDDAHKKFNLIGYWESSGKAITSNADNYRRTGLIPINHNYDIVTHCWGNKNVMALILFDAKNSVVATYPCNTKLTSAEATVTLTVGNIPDSARYFAASTNIVHVAESSWQNGPTRESREGAVSEAIQASKSAVFDDMWIKAAGSNGTVDHTHTEDNVSKPYYLNEVWMTYEEALVVYNEHYVSVESLQQRYIYGVTNFAPTENGSALSYTNFHAPNAVTINVGNGFLAASFQGWLTDSLKLTKIIGQINLRYWNRSLNSSRYIICPMLKEVSLYYLSNDFNISSLKSISLASMQYMVNNSTATSPITVTVHPDIYAKLTGDTTNAAAAALTSDELAQWTALAATANSKNISFATPE